jgi:hypothetical protein
MFSRENRTCKVAGEPASCLPASVTGVRIEPSVYNNRLPGAKLSTIPVQAKRRAPLGAAPLFFATWVFD